MKALQLQIGGMTCEHCVGAVRDTLAGLPHVTVQSVSLPDARAQVTIDDGGPPPSMLADALRKAGFLMIGFKPAALQSGGS